jgi:hypothetical protein
MAYDRQTVVHLLQALGYQEQADEAEKALPDPVSLDDLIAFSDKHGISRDELTSRMGGSP